MEVDAKVKELEDEVKVLKAEIRNVLLDIREAILENTNPLGEQHEPAYLRMDLNTTARSVAAEEAARAAREALDEARGKEDTKSAPEEPEPASASPPAEEETAEEAEGEEGASGESEEPEADLSDSPPESEAEEEEMADEEVADEEVADEEGTEDEAQGPEASDNGGLSPKAKAASEALSRLTQMPPMYSPFLLPTGAVGSLAAWVTEAMAAIGPQDLERVITIHRLWGCLPPNISYALAHLQRLIRSTREADPAWLRVMQDMEKLASS